MCCLTASYLCCCAYSYHVDTHGSVHYFRTVMFAYVCQCEIVVMAFAGKKWLAALLEEDLTHALNFSY